MSTIQYVNGNPFIEINGELLEPIAFRSFRPQPYNVAQFSRMGVRLYQMIVSGKLNALGDMYSLYGEVWVGEGKYDFTAFDLQMEMFMKFAPNGYFWVMIQLDTPKWWVEKYKNYPDSFYKLGQTVVCEEWKKAAAEYLKAFILYAEEKYKDKIFAYSYCCGLCTEWFMDDNGEATPQKEKVYKEYLNDENAVIPVLSGDEYLEKSDIRQPFSNERKYIDFCCKLNNDLVIFFAKEAQKVLNHKKLLSVFYGYIDQGTTYKQNLWFTNLYEAVWNCEDIDILTSPASYYHNRNIDGVPMYQYTVDSIPICKKLYLHEIDHRTHLSFYPLSTGKFMWDCCEDSKTSIAILRRELCNTLLKNSALWWFDFYGGYFSTPEYEQELKRQIEIYRELAREKREQVAEVAVFVDAPSMNLIKERVDLVPECVRETLTEIVKSGIMYKTFNLSDITKISADDYKLFVFANALDISQEIESYIKINLADKNKFFVYAPNIAKENLDVKNICDITGMNVEKAEDDDINHKAEFKKETFGFSKNYSPRFYINDNDVETIALYDDGKKCVCKKGNNYYSALGNVPYTLWQQVMKECGVHVYSENGCYTAITTKFIAHQNAKSEECVLNLKFDCVVEEMFDGGMYKTHNKILKYNAEKGSTKLFKIIQHL